MPESFTALSSSAHNRLRYEPKDDFGFARDKHVCPLLIGEVQWAAQTYPVVFPSGKGIIVPQQLMSVRPGINPAVNEDGSWKGGYIPLHFQRYPFFLGRPKNGKETVLMFDQDAPQLGEEGKLLYNKRGNKYVASPILKQVKERLTSYDVDYRRTRDLCALLQQADVFVEAGLKGKIDGKEHVVRGFSVVSWDRVVKLDDKILAQWARIGLIQLIHLHLQSIKNHLNIDVSSAKG